MGRKRYKPDIISINDLIHYFIDRKYNLMDCNVGYMITGNGLRGYILSRRNVYGDVGLALDLKDSFDKVTRCPILWELPISKDFLEERIVMMKEGVDYMEEFIHPGKDRVGNTIKEPRFNLLYRLRRHC